MKSNVLKSIVLLDSLFSIINNGCDDNDCSHVDEGDNCDEELLHSFASESKDYAEDAEEVELESSITSSIS